MYYSTLGSRVIKKKKKSGGVPLSSMAVGKGQKGTGSRERAHEGGMEGGKERARK